MESSRLPIELCEAVMNAFREYYVSPWSGRLLVPRLDRPAQQALCACTLTCRAWSVRAQYLLWTFPILPNSLRLVHFNMAIRKSPNKAIIRGLMLASTNMAGELFMHSFPHLQHLLCFGIRFNRGPPLRLLRMRLPFFSTITTLALFDCTFESMRAMLDVVWACSNLTTLAIGNIKHEHDYEECDCCKAVVGTSEEVVGSEKPLPELLAGLMELTIRLDECEDPGRCAAYIWSVLPGMRNVLRFEYRAWRSRAWKPYILPVAK
ncbi:hypothetical protein TRAPUB_3866 [Trametes pubescens]|uniref:F-box domain-containing protein n=1 Tax=Trametes pubescens TaxID=154538 RepID=A0A1M2VCQ5_TRAPU|nr:hypothetical protein TRAPUB_3866 [Trametes pubescens]